MEQRSKICSNPWCKGTFFFILKENETEPKECPKCRSFDKDLSGGVTWTEKKYEGDRIDGMPHPIKINVKNYFR